MLTSFFFGTLCSSEAIGEYWPFVNKVFAQLTQRIVDKEKLVSCINVSLGGFILFKKALAYQVVTSGRNKHSFWTYCSTLGIGS